MPVVAGADLPGALAGQRWPALADATELLDVDVDELAWPRALIAHGWLELEVLEAIEPLRVTPPLTVESAVLSDSAI